MGMMNERYNSNCPGKKLRLLNTHCILVIGERENEAQLSFNPTPQNAEIATGTFVASSPRTLRATAPCFSAHPSRRAATSF